MKVILMLMAIISLFSLSFAGEKKPKITKEQFCHFTYGIYQQCYQRGLMAGTSCEALSKGIKFGKAFTQDQKKYIQESCKIGCFLGRNKLRIKDENQFTKSCLK